MSASKELLVRIARTREQLDSALRALRNTGGSKANLQTLYDLIEYANELEAQARELSDMEKER